ncbi:MAG: response regulator [Desulfobacterales bacterium]|nr:response regulator [Desulfobacterales bacterium]
MAGKILLVDDEEGIRRVLGISLSDMGYEVHTAENGETALQVFRDQRPPIVLADIKMPAMDGIDLLRKLKAEDPDTEVILITGHGDMDLAIKSLKYEATDFIIKPIEDRDLESALEKARQRIKLRQQWRSYTENLEDMVRRKTDRLTAAAEAAENAGNGRFQHLFEELPGYVAVIDGDYRITEVNKAVKFDFGVDDPGGTHCYELFRGLDEPCLSCPVARSFAEESPCQEELKFTPDGGARTCHMFAWTTPLQDEAGDVSRVMIMMTDISHLLDLKDHLASLGLMVGSVSHGIKGLLTGLDGGVYMLNSGFSHNDPEEISEGLKTVKTMSSRIKRMVLDILYYAREMKLDKQPADIAEFVRETAEVVAARARESAVELVRDVDASLENSRITIDAEQLRAAIVNILENALDACAEDREKDWHRIGFRAFAENGTLCFDISDTGPGMEAEIKENIFKLFYSSKRSQGTGIGLFITRKIVSQHNGTIEVESAPGRGTRFRIRIPYRQ